MPIAALIASLFSPAVDLVKKIIGKEEDQTKALAELEGVQAKIIDTVTQLEKEKYDLMKAEVNSTNWLTQAWRPICSILIVLIIVLASFGLCHPNEELYKIAEVFLGIYGGGRSLEKAIDIVKGK